MLLTVYGTEWPILCWCAVKKLLTHCSCLLSDLLTLIRETENDDLTSVLQKFVCEYSDDIAPLAVEITTHLVRAELFLSAALLDPGSRLMLGWVTVCITSHQVDSAFYPQWDGTVSISF